MFILLVSSRSENRMKIDRLIGILSVLLQEEKVTAPDLAERFEVSRRTINRDIDDLLSEVESALPKAIRLTGRS